MSVAVPTAPKMEIIPPSIKGKPLTGNLNFFRSDPLNFLTILARQRSDITSVNLVGQSGNPGATFQTRTCTG